MASYLVTILTLVAIISILGLALNLQWGLCGMVNFGLTGFFALGAYTAAIVGLSGAGTFAATLAAVVVCSLACGLVALVSLRLSEDYLAILTLGFGEVVRLVVLNEEWLTHGSLGLPGIPRPFWGLVSEDKYEYLFLGLLALVILGLFIALEMLLRSPFGRAIRAVREDDVVAATLGKNVLMLRVKVFALGGAIIGIAGSFHAFYMTYIDPSQFQMIVTAYVFMAVIAGGRGSNSGLLLGSVLLMVAIEGTRYLKDIFNVFDATQLSAIRLIMIGLGLILLLIFRPQGCLAEYSLKIKGRESKQRDIAVQTKTRAT
ncbi:MAG TPA: branched-chain amino acid ABC transporter permease [Xanthobacteraceae bacterium]|jgi:ABC-type branched-subunit amino acid transport system permease subunit|nr:branched-chain amino acid ABC transporter permease [Xanthobacteraceae bacterium]